jgi:uncharacterized protein YbjT (DUF2867 family)
MKILVTGATGNVGGEVVRNLHKGGAEVRALARKPKSVGFPAGVEVVPGDLTDPESIRAAAKGVDKLFLLNAVVADELTQALTTYGIAKRAGISHVTYLSVYKVEQFRDVPHFASKLAVENALKEFGVPYTILRPAYFYQNDLTLKPLLQGMGIYPMPIGTAGISAIDSRDVAQAAAVTLTEQGHDGQTYDLVSSSQITGPGNAALWSKALGKDIFYTGHDFDAWEKQMSTQLPGWMAYDMRAMLEGYVERGFASTEADVRRVAKLIGNEPRTYETFVKEATAAWSKDEQR